MLGWGTRLSRACAERPSCRAYHLHAPTLPTLPRQSLPDFSRLMPWMSARALHRRQPHFRRRGTPVLRARHRSHRAPGKPAVFPAHGRRAHRAGQALSGRERQRTCRVHHRDRRRRRSHPIRSARRNASRQPSRATGLGTAHARADIAPCQRAACIEHGSDEMERARRSLIHGTSNGDGLDRGQDQKDMTNAGRIGFSCGCGQGGGDRFLTASLMRLGLSQRRPGFSRARHVHGYRAALPKQVRFDQCGRQETSAQAQGRCRWTADHVSQALTKLGDKWVGGIRPCSGSSHPRSWRFSAAPQ